MDKAINNIFEKHGKDADKVLTKSIMRNDAFDADLLKAMVTDKKHSMPSAIKAMIGRAKGYIQFGDRGIEVEAVLGHPDNLRAVAECYPKTDFNRYIYGPTPLAVLAVQEVDEAKMLKKIGILYEVAGYDFSQPMVFASKSHTPDQYLENFEKSGVITRAAAAAIKEMQAAQKDYGKWREDWFVARYPRESRIIADIGSRMQAAKNSGVITRSDVEMLMDRFFPKTR